MAYQDELAAANRLPTREQRLSARNAVRAKYGMETEKRKRGGIAGLYDRNKGVIQAALPTLAGFLVPGSSVLAGALTGGLARGLDRPGKRGIGLDLGQAAGGALVGAGLGKLGGGFRGAPAAPAPAAPAPGMPAGPAPGQVMATPNYGAQIGTEMAAAAPAAPVTAATTAAPTTIQKLLAAVQKPEVLAPLAGGVADVIGSAQDRAVQERRIQLEEEQMRQERERQERLAQLLMPLFQQQVSQFGGRR